MQWSSLFVLLAAKIVQLYIFLYDLIDLGCKIVYYLLLDIYKHRGLRKISDVYKELALDVAGRAAFFREITGPINKEINVKDWETGNWYKCTNFGSYDYLGVSNLHNPNELSTAYSEAEDYDSLENEVRHRISALTGQEDSILFNTGYSCNALGITRLLGIEDLKRNITIFSDRLNHASIIQGLCKGKSCVRVFDHGNLPDLVRKVLDCDSEEIWIMLEGVFSVHGTVPDIQGIVELKSRKSGVKIFIDEAHSFGCLGLNGRGVCDFRGVDLSQVDVIVGTLSKSCNSFGGFIAAPKYLIERLSRNKMPYNRLDKIALYHVRTVLKLIDSDEGRRRLKHLNEISEYTYDRLVSSTMYTPFGTRGSPVICFDAGLALSALRVSKRLQSHGVAITLVGYPAASKWRLTARLCMSASHTREDVDNLIDLLCEKKMDHLLASARMSTVEASAPLEELERHVREDADRGKLYALETYGFGNSGPRGFLANLNIFLRMETLIGRCKNKKDCSMISCTYSGYLSFLKLVSLEYDHVYVKMSDYLKAVTHSTPNFDNVVFIADVYNAEHFSEKTLFIHDGTWVSIPEECKQCLFDLDAARMLSPRENYDYICGPLQPQGFYVCHDNIARKYLNLSAYVFSATLPIYMVSDLFAKLLKQETFIRPAKLQNMSVTKVQPQARNFKDVDIKPEQEEFESKESHLVHVV